MWLSNAHQQWVQSVSSDVISPSQCWPPIQILTLTRHMKRLGIDAVYTYEIQYNTQLGITAGKSLQTTSIMAEYLADVDHI